MAHTFLKKTLNSESRGYQVYVFIFFLGGFFFLNSYMAEWLFSDREASELPALLSALLFGFPLLYNALKDLFTGQIEMNELAGLSFAASFCTNNYRAASVIALFMLISHLIEFRSQLSARKNIESLMQLSPEKARVLVNGTFIEIDAEKIKEGDLLQVLPGDRIPGDGVVLEGFSTVDESAITGESVPVEKKEESKVFSGSLNVTGRLVLKVTSRPEETVLSKIKNLIHQAEKSRTPVMRLINKYAAWYTPTILMIAGIVLFFTRDIERAISLLIISCPCTVILSGPTALVTALGAAARAGVIFRNVSILEQVRKVDTVIFDKTGTLTYGSLCVSSVMAFNGKGSDELLMFAGSIEQYSNHPSAKAIIRECNKQKIPYSTTTTDFMETPGMGVSGTVNGQAIDIGRQVWIQAKCPEGTILNSDEDTTGSYLYMLINGMHAGTFQLMDTLKPDAYSTIRSLRDISISNIYMFTGDRKPAAEKIANQLGCACESEMLPHEKMDRIRDAKKKGCIVAMVGDGINDAPALAAGDVSIAMGGTGSDAAIHSASIVLMNDRLDRIPFIFQLSKKTISIIQQNISFSILFIVIMIGLSATGIVSPVLAAILHSLSTVIVVVNSARLLREGVLPGAN